MPNKSHIKVVLVIILTLWRCGSGWIRIPAILTLRWRTTNQQSVRALSLGKVKVMFCRNCKMYHYYHIFISTGY